MDKQPIVPEQDAAYLHANHKTQTVPDMAKKLKRAPGTVYGFMTALGLEPKARQITRSHPFRRANRSLEAQIIHNRQLKTGRTS